MKKTETFKSTLLALALGVASTLFSQWLLVPESESPTFAMNFVAPTGIEEVHAELRQLRRQLGSQVATQGGSDSVVASPVSLRQ